jgi:hypothetical protein
MIQNLPTRPSQPISRAAASMGECQHPDLGFRFYIDNMVGKLIYRRTADTEVVRHSRYGGSGLGEESNLVESHIDSGNKLISKPRTLFLVPLIGLSELGESLSFCTEGLAHLSEGETTCARASAHSIPLDSPTRKRRARRSISTAQAASMSPASSSAGSRLSRSSAARSALSGSGSSKASRKIRAAFVLMSGILPLEHVHQGPKASQSSHNRLVGRVSKSSLRGMERRAWSRASGGAVSFRASRSSQPPVLVTRAAIFPSSRTK